MLARLLAKKIAFSPLGLTERREAPGQAAVSFSLLKVGLCPPGWARGGGELWLGSGQQHTACLPESGWVAPVS